MTSETKFARISDDKRLTNDVSLFVSKSEISSEANKTGSWRFARPVYQNKTAPCSAACPAGTDIPRIEWLISQGLVKTAWETFFGRKPISLCVRTSLLSHL